MHSGLKCLNRSRGQPSFCLNWLQALLLLNQNRSREIWLIHELTLLVKFRPKLLMQRSILSVTDRFESFLHLSELFDWIVQKWENDQIFQMRVCSIKLAPFHFAEWRFSIGEPANRLLQMEIKMWRSKDLIFSFLTSAAFSSLVWNIWLSTGWVSTFNFYHNIKEVPLIECIASHGWPGFLLLSNGKSKCMIFKSWPSTNSI